MSTYAPTAPQELDLAPARSVSTVMILGACMALPIVFSLSYFLHQSLRLDEAQSLWQTSRSFGDVITTVAGDVHVPLYHVVLRLWRLYIGDSVTAARLLSLLAYVVSIPALYLLGKTAHHRRTGLFAAFLFAISPFMNWYGNEVRMYTLFTLFIILNQYFYIRLFKDEQPSDHVWAGYILTAVAGVFTHYFFALALLSQAVFFFLRRELFEPRALQRFLLAAAIVIVSFTPWAIQVALVGTAGFQDPVLTKPTSVDLFNTLSQFMVGFQNDNVNKFFLSLWPIVVIVRLFSLRRSERLSKELEYFTITLLFSFAVAFAVSVLISPVFVSRYLVFTIPAFYILLASLVDAYPVRSRRLAQGAIVVLMASTLALEMWNPTMPLQENYAQAAEYLTAHTTPQDAIILSAPFTIYPVQYYYKGSAPIRTLPVWDQYAHGGIPAFNESELPAQVEQIASVHQNIYVLLSYDQGYEKTIKDYFDKNYQMISQERFSRGLNLYVYRVRYDTARSAISAEQGA
jgi:mannosyltransferase